MGLSYCSSCGEEIKKVPLRVTGDLIEIEPNFCRMCGHSLYQAESLDAEGELDELPDWDDLADFATLEDVIQAALPENHQELTLEQLTKHIVQSLWKRFTGTDPFISAEQQAAWDKYHEEQMQRFVERGTPPQMIRPAPRSHWDESFKDLVRPYHLIWVNGLIQHTNLAPEEAEQEGLELAKYYYTLEPCDCDKVQYVPNESNPHFLRKA